MLPLNLHRSEYGAPFGMTFQVLDLSSYGNLIKEAYRIMYLRVLHLVDSLELGRVH